MTDHEKLREELKKEDTMKYPKNLTITTLIGCVKEETGELPKELYVPEYEVDKNFFFETLAKLGYNFTYEEEYNPYFEQYCYKVQLS